MTDQQRELKATPPAVSVCERKEITVTGPDIDGIWTLTIATEEGDQEVWLHMEGVEALQNALRTSMPPCHCTDEAGDSLCPRHDHLHEEWGEDPIPGAWRPNDA